MSRSWPPCTRGKDGISPIIAKRGDVVLACGHCLRSGGASNNHHLLPRGLPSNRHPTRLSELSSSGGRVITGLLLKNIACGEGGWGPGGGGHRPGTAPKAWSAVGGKSCWFPPPERREWIMPPPMHSARACPSHFWFPPSTSSFVSFCSFALFPRPRHQRYPRFNSSLLPPDSGTPCAFPQSGPLFAPNCNYP